MNRYLIISVILLFSFNYVNGQCFVTSGNPVGGTSNFGVMNKNSFRISSYYNFFYSDQYFSGSEHYDGSKAVLKYAKFNYTGLYTGYGISDRLTAELETGYYFNKTQAYKIEDAVLSGKGFSNVVASIKPRLYINQDKRFEVAAALGLNIPISNGQQIINGVVLPMGVQPSTGSYGVVLQSQLIKENSFRGIRFFFNSRIEKYFSNQQDFLAGNYYYNALFFSKHYVIESLALQDWTLILQLRNQIQQRNIQSGNRISASGNVLFFLTPQINLSIGDSWNASVLADIPIYQYYNGVQIGNRYAFSIAVIRDFHLKNK